MCLPRRVKRVESYGNMRGAGGVEGSNKQSERVGNE